MAQEVASRGVTVNCVAPGFIATPMTDALDERLRAMTTEAGVRDVLVVAGEADRPAGPPARRAVLVLPALRGERGPVSPAPARRAPGHT